MNTDHHLKLRAAVEGAAADFECIAAAISSVLQADEDRLPARASSTLILLESFALDRRNAANEAIEAVLETRA